MKHKVFSIVFITLCLVLCLSLSLGMVFAGPAAAGANEQLAEPPILITEEGRFNTWYLQDLSSYIRDRFFLRQELISLHHWLSAKVLGTSGDDGVILGSDGWLYYADTLADYTGTAPMTERELFASANNLRLMQEYCDAQGKQFLFLIAPNKNSLYPEHMPDFGIRAKETNAHRLLARLDEMGVATVDLFAAFHKEDAQLYFAHDSHWNSRGAALGADLINAAFGISSSYYSGDFSQTEPHQGDLYTMLYPAFTDPELDALYSGSLSFEFTTSATRPDAIMLRTESGKEGNLLAYRDSFGILLFPFLADSYGTAQFSRSTAYDLTKDADYVLIELVERNLSYLYTNLPVMPAPETTIVPLAEITGTVTVTAVKRGDWLQVKGQLPSVGPTDSIYVVCDTACGNTAYQAFCLGETGFGLNLAPELTPQYVLCSAENGDTVACYKIEIQS